MPAAAILVPRRRPGHPGAAHDEWGCGGERRHEQPEEDPTRCQARPDRAVHDAMLPLAVGQITPANGTQRATAHPSPGREESPDQEHRNVPPSWTREQRPERRQACDHVCGEEQQGTTSWLKWSSAYSSPLLSAQWTQSSSGRVVDHPTPQQVKVGTPEGLPLEHFEAVHVSLHLPVRTSGQLYPMT